MKNKVTKQLNQKQKSILQLFFHPKICMFLGRWGGGVIIPSVLFNLLCLLILKKLKQKVFCYSFAGRVFLFLSTYLGNEWRMLITVLPGWQPTKANAVIEQSMLNERFVKDQIFACLKAWKQQCTHKVTRYNILRALEAPGVERMDLKQKLETMSATSAWEPAATDL